MLTKICEQWPYRPLNPFPFFYCILTSFLSVFENPRRKEFQIGEISESVYVFVLAALKIAIFLGWCCNMEHCTIFPLMHNLSLHTK